MIELAPPDMTLLDYFAAQAMAARLNAAWAHPASSLDAYQRDTADFTEEEKETFGFDDWLAVKAYASAKAMIKVRAALESEPEV